MNDRALQPFRSARPLAITAALLSVLAAFARRKVNLLETALLAIGLALFSVGLFVYGLSQPFPAWWGR